jgi:hypothetical protein
LIASTKGEIFTLCDSPVSLLSALIWLLLLLMMMLLLISLRTPLLLCLLRILLLLNLLLVIMILVHPILQLLFLRSPQIPILRRFFLRFKSSSLAQSMSSLKYGPSEEAKHTERGISWDHRADSPLARQSCALQRRSAQYHLYILGHVVRDEERSLVRFNAIPHKPVQVGVTHDAEGLVASCHHVFGLEGHITFGGKSNGGGDETIAGVCVADGGSFEPSIILPVDGNFAFFAWSLEGIGERQLMYLVAGGIRLRASYHRAA